MKGSHGRLPDDPADGPLVLTSRPELLRGPEVATTEFKGLTLDHVFA